MDKRDKRMKAQDIFRETEFVFAKKVKFAEAFPMIETILITGHETGRGTNYAQREIRRDETNGGEYINCSNPMCYNGGYHLGELVREMVMANLEEKSDSKICQGSEGSPKGRKIYRHCMNTFKIDVKIAYRAKTDSRPQ